MKSAVNFGVSLQWWLFSGPGLVTALEYVSSDLRIKMYRQTYVQILAPKAWWCLYCCIINDVRTPKHGSYFVLALGVSILSHHCINAFNIIVYHLFSKMRTNYEYSFTFFLYTAIRRDISWVFPNNELKKGIFTISQRWERKKSTQKFL